MKKFPAFHNWSGTYGPVDKKKLVEKMRAAMDLIVFMPPFASVHIRVSRNIINLQALVRELLR